MALLLLENRTNMDDFVWKQYYYLSNKRASNHWQSRTSNELQSFGDQRKEVDVTVMQRVV